MKLLFIVSMLVAAVMAVDPTPAQQLDQQIVSCVAERRKAQNSTLVRCGYNSTAVLPVCGYNTNSDSPSMITNPLNSNCCLTRSSCRPCLSADKSLCPPPQALPFCNSTKVTQFAGCCPSCKSGFAPASSANAARQMDDDMIQRRGSMTNPCTPAVIAALPYCNDTNSFAVDSNSQCPTCRPANGLSGSCSNDQVQQCSTLAASLPACDAGESPTRDPVTCCLSCVPSTSTLEDQFKKNKCDSDKASKQCSNMLSNNMIRNCDATTQEVPSFNTTSCCLTCVNQTAKTQFQPQNGVCQRSVFAQCMSTVYPCQAGSRAVQVSTPGQSCCPSCVQAESLCTPEQVVMCQRSQRACLANETQVHLTGECCGSCRPPAPATVSCPTCSTGNICIKVRNAGAWTAKCVASSTYTFAFSTADDTRRKTIGNFSATDAPLMLNEMVRRFCETQSSSVACALFVARQYVLDMNVISVNASAPGVLTVTVQLPTASIAASDSADNTLSSIALFGVKNTLFQSSASMSDLATTASTDSYASSGYSVQVTSDTAPAPAPKSSTGVSLKVELTALVGMFTAYLMW
jgi:hypothetical protein